MTAAAVPSAAKRSFTAEVIAKTKPVSWIAILDYPMTVAASAHRRPTAGSIRQH
jgi:hypothetical protein